jgi:hypothetical protein
MPPRSRGAIRPICAACPSKNRAQGMLGARRTHSLACESKKARRVSHHRYNAINRHSLRDGFNAYFVLSPVTGLFCHRRLADTSAKLDASVGAPGPHDFAVRFKLRSSTRRQSVHRIPLPTSVTIAIRPSCGNGMAGISGGDLPDGTSEIFFRGGLDDPNRVESPHENRSLRASDFERPKGRTIGTTAEKFN